MKAKSSKSSNAGTENDVEQFIFGTQTNRPFSSVKLVICVPSMEIS